MSNARNLADLLDANGDVKSGALDNVSGLPDAIDVDASAPADSLNIDSSGNLLVGQSSTIVPGLSNTTTGLSLTNNGYIFSSKDGDTVAWLNRNTSDGSIVSFRKDGSSVGIIGAKSSDLTIGTSDTGIRFLDGADSVMPVNPTTGADSDATLNLGVASARWKDLYLSGGVYVGGTGSANYLDDYEEGTFTPVPSATSSAPTISGYWSQTGTYTKIGNVVVANIDLSIQGTSGGSGNLVVTGLPFTANGRHFGTMAWESLSIGSNVQQLTPYVPSGQSYILFYPSENNNSTGGDYAWDGGLYGWFKVTITYKTNS